MTLLQQQINNLSFVRFNSSEAKAEETQTLNLTNRKLNILQVNNKAQIKLNARRNQTRFFNTSQTLISYIIEQARFSDNIKNMFLELISALDTMYSENPSEFCDFSKKVGNWYKVNAFRLVRLQDSIGTHEWNGQMKCPMILTDFFPVLDLIKDPEQKLSMHRILLSIFDLYQVVIVRGSAKLNTITDSYSGNDNYWDQIDIDRSLSMLGIDKELFRAEFENANRNTPLHTSSAAGPNGQALWMAHVDARAVFYNKELLANLTNFAALVGKSTLIEKMEDTVKIPQFFKLTEGQPVSSRLHFIYEKGNKVRTIAILDWWTQELLTPLHNVIANLLKLNPQDGTFDQDKIANSVREFTSYKGSSLFSYDLTAATDRLPIELQVKILDTLTGIESFGRK